MTIKPNVVKSNVVKIDARAAGYEGEPVRIMALTLVDSGKIVIAKQADWREPIKPQDDVSVITDTPTIHSHWSMAFDEQKDIKDLLKTYFEIKRSNLLKIEDDLRMFDPREVIQTSKIDERGQVIDFDTGVTNGHVAILMAIWGARKAYGGYITTERAEADIDDTDELQGYSSNDDYDAMMPYSVG